MKKIATIPLLTPIPALCIGAVVMHQSGISPLIFGQNLLCYLLLGLVVFFFGSRHIRFLSRRPVVLAFLICCCAMLAATFVDKGLENVHRWFALGGFRLNVASLIVPSAAIGISALLKQKNNIEAVIITAIVSVCLVLQPDASQLTAFSIAIIFLFWKRSSNRALMFFVALIGVAFTSYSWVNIDTLAPVLHVEEILFLALDRGFSWFVLGVASLVVFMLPFFTLLRNSDNGKAMGLYYAAVIASTFFGSFPMPFMGQGVSPIIGYLLAVYLLLQTKSLSPVISQTAFA